MLPTSFLFLKFAATTDLLLFEGAATFPATLRVVHGLFPLVWDRSRRCGLRYRNVPDCEAQGRAEVRGLQDEARDSGNL